MATRYSTRSRRASGSATAEPAVDGLTGAGQRPGPDSELFAQGEFSAFLDMLRDASSASGRVVLLTGPDNADKTALCEALLDTIDAPWSAAWVSAGAESDGGHDAEGEHRAHRRILAAVLDAYEIPVDGGISAAAAGELVVQHAPAGTAAAEPCLVVVDDADSLPLEDLRALLALAERAALCLVLTGAGELESAVAGMAPEYALELRTIRLASGDAVHPEAPARPPADGARSSSARRQTDERTARRGSRGRVRERRSLAGLADVVARLTGSGDAGADAAPGSGGPFGFPKRHLIALAGLFVLLLVVYIAGSGDDEATDATQSSQRVETLEMPPLDTPDDVAGAAAAGQGASDQSDEKASTAAGGSTTADSRPATPAAPRPIISRPSAPAATTQAASPATQPAESQPPPATLPAPSGTPSAPATAPAAAVAAAAPAMRDARWINAQPATAYTVQLVSLSSAERAASYIAQQPDPGSYATYRLMRNGQLFHVVVYGNFASKAEADRVATQLPRSVGNIQPWVRPFDQVQESMRSTPQP
jgi:septal ring-binding cell division protein DamX